MNWRVFVLLASNVTDAVRWFREAPVEMVDKLLNLINPLLVNPVRGPSADHDQRLWLQIHGRVLAIPIQPTKGHF